MKQYINKVINNPLFSGSTIMIIGFNSANALNYLYHLIMGRLLGPTFYGELAALISVIGLLGILPSALSLVIVKQISSAKNETEVNNLITWFKEKMFKLSLIFFVVLLILSPLISSFLHISKISYLLLISFSFLFSLQAGFNRSILQGLLKFKELITTILVENATKLLVSILLILVGFAVGGAVLSFVFTSFFGLWLTDYYLKIKKRNDPKISIDLKPTLMLAIPFLIQSIATTSLYSSDVVLVKHFFSSHDAGIYASLSTLGKIIFFGAGPIGAVMFPLVSERSSKGENYKKVFIYSFVATVLFAMGICLVYWLLPNFAINLLFGPSFLESSKLLIWFGIFMSIFTLSSLFISFGLSLGKNEIVIFPLIFAVLQIILISFFHDTIFLVIIISIVITALLLLSLLIYLIFEKGIIYGKNISTRDKLNLNNRPGI